MRYFILIYTKTVIDNEVPNYMSASDITEFIRTNMDKSMFPMKYIPI